MEIKKEFRPERTDIVSFWVNGNKISEGTRLGVINELNGQKQQLEVYELDVVNKRKELYNSTSKIEPQKLSVIEAERAVENANAISIPFFGGKSKQAEKDKLIADTTQLLATAKQELEDFEKQVETCSIALQGCIDNVEIQRGLVEVSEEKLRLIEGLFK